MKAKHIKSKESGDKEEIQIILTLEMGSILRREDKKRQHILYMETLSEHFAPFKKKETAAAASDKDLGKQPTIGNLL